MCAPSPPPAPDYTGSAIQQGQANVDAAKLQGQINNPNVINPYGTQTVTYGSGVNQPAFDQAQQLYQKQLADWQAAGGVDRVQIGMSRNQPVYKETPRPRAPSVSDYALGDPNQLTLTQKFSPEQQAIFDESNKAKLAMSQLASRGAGVAGDIIGKNLDLTGLPPAPTSGQVNEDVINAIMGRVNEDYDRATEDKNAALIAAGHRVGGKGYDDSMNLLQRGRNDAQLQAILAGYQQGGKQYEQDAASRRNALAELITQRTQPLNELGSLLSGSQVQNPFAIPQYAQNAQVAAAPLFGATQLAGDWNSDLYNVDAAQAGNLQSGLFGLGGAGLQAYGLRSDRRLKSNIVRIGTHPLGIGWYEYDMDGTRQQGVMADEVRTVRPDAVMRGDDGYDRVFYDRLG